MAVRKDGKTGKWFYDGKYKTIDGTTKGYKKRGFVTKKEAKESEHLFLMKISGSAYGRIRLRELVQLYASHFITLGIKESTLISNESYYYAHIDEVFGDEYVDKITADKIDRFKAHMASKDVTINKKAYPGRKYATRTVNRALGVLKMYLSYAVQRNLISFNPARNVKKYTNPDEIIEVTDSYWNFWEVTTYNDFIKCVDDEFWHDVFSFLFNTGVREGELFALTWNKIDFDNHTILITSSATSKTKGGGVRMTTPKTKKSIRKIDMQNTLENMLLNRFRKCQKIDGFKNDYYVFGDIRPLSRSSLARWLERYIQIAKVKRITPHGFRHSHASMLIDARIDDDLIADRLGHSIQELHNTYAHSYEKRKTNMRNALDNLYSNGANNSAKIPPR